MTDAARSDIAAVGLVPIAEAVPRTVVTVSGKVSAVVVEPSDNVPMVTARVSDSTGTVYAKFMGRRMIEGIEPGAHITLRGCACKEHDALTIYNPTYELRIPT